MVPLLESQEEEVLREGLKRKVTPVKMFLERVPAQFDKILTAKIEDSPLFEKFKDISSNFSDETKKSLQARAKKIIETENINNVVFIGFIKNKEKIRTLLDSDIFILPSQTTSFLPLYSLCLMSGLGMSDKKCGWLVIGFLFFNILYRFFLIFPRDR